MSDHPNDKPENDSAEPAAEASPASAAPTSKDTALTQEQLLRRVDALAKDEDEADRIANLEEAKLAERRAKLKKGKKTGLEAAASKRLAKIGEKAPVKRNVATAVDADPLIDRTAQLGKWVEKNSKGFAWIVAAALVAGIAVAGYNQYKEKKETDASAVLSQAVASERGRIGDPEKDDGADKLKDPTPIFKTVEERRDAALKQYRDVVAKYAGTGAATLARLGEAAVLLDNHEVDGAIAAFTEVRSSPLAQADVDVRARALEGLGFAYEQKGAAEAAKLDDALKAFKDLEGIDVKGFKELGMYHQARVQEAKGEKTKAIETLKSLRERVNKLGENHPFPYLEPVVDDRLRALDPSALPPKSAGHMEAMPGGAGKQISPEQIKRLMEQMQKGGDEHGSGGAPPMPMPPPGTP